MRNTISRLESGFTDPESSVHLKLNISAFKNVQIRVDGSDPWIKNITYKASIPMLTHRNVDIEVSRWLDNCLI